MTQTVLLTGVTGFIAKRIAADLLNAGYAVRGSRRSAGRDDEVRSAVAPALADPAAIDRLSFVSLDLTSDAGWAEAMEGVDALVHTASPFPMDQPRNEEELIRPAVDGTLRALRAAQAAGITRVVLTSSIVAVMHKELRDGQVIGPDDWTDTDHPSCSAYAKSKTLAERAAWDFVAVHPEMRLSAINPGLVLGPPMDMHYGTSLAIVEQFLTGALPAIPNFGMAIIDIRDVSAAHVRALQVEEAAGRRFLLTDSYVMAPEMARILREAFPEAKVPSRRAPDWLVKVMALFDGRMKTLKPILGLHLQIDNSATRRILGIDPIPAEEAIRAAGAAVMAKLKAAA